MAAITYKAFRGQVPRVSERLLQPNQAVRALNCKITSGRLDPLAGLGQVLSVPITIRTARRYRVFRNNQLESNWLLWDSDVDFVPSLVANDEVGRFYFAGENIEPRMSTYELAINSVPYPTAWYVLGVTPPTAAASVTVAGGTSPVESRAYVYTFVTQFGEESPPSPPSTVVSGNANGTWTVASMQVAPTNSGTISDAEVIDGGRVRITVDTVFGIEQYDTLAITSVGGMTDLNTTVRVLAVDPTGPYIEVALQTMQEYTSGGAWARKAPHNTTNMVKRIYRTVGTGGDFLFVAEIPVATTSYVDAVEAADLGEILPTADSSTPPKDMKTLVAMPNGCLVGIAGNQLCFSDPYLPYSWPERNRYTFSGRGVSVVPSVNAAILLTDSFPIVFTGSDPEAMSASTSETYAPCVSKRGVTDVGGGALYPSFDGLWLISPAQVQCVTRKLYTEDEWSELNPSSFDSAFHDNKYYGAFVGADRSRIFVLDMGDPDSSVEVDEVVTEVFRNEADGKLYVAKNTKLYEWDVDVGRSYESEWFSATTQLPKPINIGAAQVHAEFGDIVPPDTTQIAANEALIAEGPDAVSGYLAGHEFLAYEVAGSAVLPAVVGTNKRVQLTLYSDDVPIFTKNVVSNKAFRLPAGYLTETVNIGINSSIRTYSVSIAETMDELSRTSA